MLVMGAHTRNPLQSAIFGGMTNAVLKKMPVLVLMTD